MRLLPPKTPVLILQLLTLLIFALLLMTIAPPQVWALDEDSTAELKKAEQIYRKEGPEPALPLFEQLRGAYQKANNTDAEGTAIRFIGEIHWRLGDFEKSDHYLQQALTMKQQNGDLLQEGKTLNVLGLLNWDLGEYDAAKGYFQQGTDIAQELGDNKLAGAILNNLSLVYDELGDYRVSLQQYQQVLDLYSSIEFPRGEGDTLGNIGGVYLLLGQFGKALSNYKQALIISEQLQSVSSMSQDHGNIALAHDGLGHTKVALEHYERAIDLAGQSGMRQDVTYWQRGRASSLIRSGKYDLALLDYRAALAAYEEIGAPAETLETMHDMGRLHLLLGDSATAEDWFNQAMDKARDIGLARGITLNLLALGDLQARQKAWEKAGAFYLVVNERTRESGEMVWYATSLLRLSAIHQQQGQYDLAVEESRRALSIAETIEARPEIAVALYSLAELERLNGNPQAAQKGFKLAQESSQDLLDPDLLWRIHYGNALVLDELGDQQDAIAELLKAVKLIEGVRNRLEEQRFRAGYLQDKYQVYVELVRLQVETGELETAFSTAERLRSRSFVELLETQSTMASNGEDTDAATILAERIRQLRSALAEEQALERPEQRQLAMEVYSSELIAAEREYQELLENRQNRRSPTAGFASNLALVPSYAAVREHLAANEALLEYVVGTDSTLVFILTRDSLLTESIQMGHQDLDARVELLRDLIRRPDNDRWIKPAQKLADALIKPIKQSGALSDINHLYLVPHGSLNYLPFALLPDSDSSQVLVIENYTLAYLPTAAALVRRSRKSVGSKSLLALAPNRSNLKYAPAEAQSVNDMFKPDSSLLLGDAATETSFKILAGDFSILHLATHGYFNKMNPLLSGLELEKDADNDGQLELFEILELQLNAELVTLSACQTALGTGHFAETPAGDDFVGLTRAFIYAGSQSVLATLWRVDDRSTKELMQGFYTRLKQNGSNKAIALALAQREMKSTRNYQHPYYWAPFILVGESA